MMLLEKMSFSIFHLLLMSEKEKMTQNLPSFLKAMNYSNSKKCSMTHSQKIKRKLQKKIKISGLLNRVKEQIEEMVLLSCKNSEKSNNLLTKKIFTITEYPKPILSKSTLKGHCSTIKENLIFDALLFILTITTILNVIGTTKAM